MNINDYSQTLARLITINDKEYPYKKIDGQYKTYCPYCQKYNVLSPAEFREVRSKKKCPLCGNKFHNTTRTHLHKTYYDGVIIEEDGMTVGYHINSEWTFGENVKLTRIDKFLVKMSNYVHVKKGYYLSGMFYNFKIGCHFDEVEDVWHKSNSMNWDYSCWDYYGDWVLNYGTRKDRRKVLEDAYHISKSSQIALASQLNDSKLIYALKIFDLNKLEDVENYKEYLMKNKTHLYDFAKANIRLNNHYLDYLSKNNIDLGKYYVFLEDLKTLKFKYEKPTDFEDRAKKVMKMAESEKDKTINLKINARFNELPRYSKDNVKIAPFETAGEIRHCGKYLHNCIGGYVSMYATKETDIYHLDLDGALTIAIEINKGTLKQAYADKNHACPDDLMEHIKSFCEENHFRLGRYA